jgi:hypothetical protein
MNEWVMSLQWWELLMYCAGLFVLVGVFLALMKGPK